MIDMEKFMTFDNKQEDIMIQARVYDGSFIYIFTNKIKNTLQ